MSQRQTEFCKWVLGLGGLGLCGAAIFGWQTLGITFGLFSIIGGLLAVWWALEISWGTWQAPPKYEVRDLKPVRRR